MVTAPPSELVGGRWRVRVLSAAADARVPWGSLTWSAHGLGCEAHACASPVVPCGRGLMESGVSIDSVVSAEWAVFGVLEVTVGSGVSVVSNVADMTGLSDGSEVSGCVC